MFHNRISSTRRADPAGRPDASRYIEFTREEMQAAAETLCTRGIDRIVPVGQALAFAQVWDGYVLLGEN